MPDFTITLKQDELDTLHEHRIKQMPPEAPETTKEYIEWLMKGTIESYNRSIQDTRFSNLTATQIKKALDYYYSSGHTEP
jgi:hypothetical protein